MLEDITRNLNLKSFLRITNQGLLLSEPRPSEREAKNAVLLKPLID